MLKTKLAGMHLPLQDAVARTIEEARERMKLAAAEKDEGKDKEKVKKLVAYEKKEHGHIPSEDEEKKEKCSSAIDPFDPEEVEKLAQALDFASEKLAAEGTDLGKEHAQGGQVLPVMKPVGGTQPYKKDSSKSHNVPTSTPKDSKPPDQTGAGELVQTNLKNPAGFKSPYPKKGVLKTGSAVARLQAVVEKQAGVKETAGKAFHAIKGGAQKGFAAAKGFAAKHPAAAAGTAAGVAGFAAGRASKRKESSAEAVDYILGKIATELGGEHKQGGETLANKAPVPSNAGRQLISSNKAPASANKREAKAPRKKELAEVLTEPALSAAHDSKVNENLPKANSGKVSKIAQAQDPRSATKGGAKTAGAAKALLLKIAEEGCQCDGKGTCRHCKMKAAMKKQSHAA